MKKINFLPLFLVLIPCIMGSGLSSCTYDPTDPPVVTYDSSKVRFKGNASTTYEQYALDTADANGNGKDTQVGSKITVNSVVVDTNGSYYGKSQVVVVKNTY